MKNEFSKITLKDIILILDVSLATAKRKAVEARQKLQKPAGYRLTIEAFCRALDLPLDKVLKKLNGK